ncbi:nucleoside phosphorylase-I family protein [Methylotetracoccus oryzae]|uniref:5'-methylthioadenosine/S-adenosylhomocysteine nucleosidase n=1 Tax=Methylotetracoccus oryzae TaxID=1919059 RepID=UPI001119C58D|nr:5'-methylthioadenosine/S-adenosylhomocysteine nucleosidase [Methylotetracoccus oryzae]
MRPTAETFVHFVVALPAEAKPLIAHYQLKRRTGEDAFAIFEKDGISLTVAGVGKLATAAAVAYTHVLFGKPANAIWLNVGLAGHAHHPLGSAWLAHKVTDAERGKSWYPAIAFKAACPSAEIRTVSQPETEYAGDCLYDMEAAAFLDAASRFSTLELIHCLKAVSDNRDHAICDIDPARASAWVDGIIDTVTHTQQCLRRLAEQLRPAATPDQPDWLAALHFTAQQRLQLDRLLQRWHVLTDNRPLPEPPVIGNGREALGWLLREIEREPVIWGGRPSAP